MKKSITIPKISGRDAGAVPAGAAAVKIDSHNWAGEFPYAPAVVARLWHDGANLFVNYTVDEESIRAAAAADGGEVWCDSCAELFLTFGEPGYYNLEANCAGKLVFTHRLNRNDEIVPATSEVFGMIERRPSLGSGAFDTKEAAGPWSLTLRVPAGAFFKHDFKQLDGLSAKGNIYKCGDLLPRPHFLSWNAVGTPTPDFHRPEYFAEISFE